MRIPDKLTITLLLIFLIQLISSFHAGAQEIKKVQPGDETVDGSFIKPYVNKWNVYIRNSSGDENLVRVWTDYTQLLAVRGQMMLHRVQDLYGADGSREQTWVNVVDHNTLSPVRFSLYTTSGGHQEIRFEADSLAYSFRGQSGEFQTEFYGTDHPVFDWNLYGILLAGLPFDEGSRYQLRYWSQNSRSVEILKAEIGEVERVDTDLDMTTDAQKVTTDKGLTFWLKKSPPYVIGLELAMENGSRMIWKMTE